MLIRTRRRVAAGGVLVTAAVVAGVLVTTAAPAAAAITQITPNFGFNNESARQITITADSSNFCGGETVTFRRTTLATDVFTATTATTTTGTVCSSSGGAVGGSSTATATVNLQQQGDGPVNSGVYNVEVSRGGNVIHSCTACFSVFLPGQPSLASASPNGVSVGGAANVTFTGANFSRGATLDVLRGDGTVDTLVNANGRPLNADGTVTAGPQTTNTTITRRVSVLAGAQLGPRDVRINVPDVTDPSGVRSAICSGCLTINGGPITGVSPSSWPNNTDAPVRITFTGSGGLDAGTPRLVYIKDAGSSTKDALSITGTDVAYSSDGRAVAANFDLRGAAPGTQAYSPTLVRDDGSTNSCTTSSCLFSVGQASAPVINDVEPATQEAGTTQDVVIQGSNLSRGVRVALSGGPEAKAVVNATNPDGSVSTTRITATFEIPGDAAAGERDIIVTSTDTKTSTCVRCYTVTAAAASPTPTATETETATPTAEPTETASPTESPTATATTTPTDEPGVGERYVALPRPERVLDSRSASNVGTTPGKKRGAVVLSLADQITGPATGAVLNVTVTAPGASGHVVVYADGAQVPPTSNVNFVRGQTQANEVVTRINTQTKRVVIHVESSAGADLVVDLVGYLTNTDVSGAGRITTLTPQRVYGSSPSSTTTGMVSLDLTGRIPAGSTSAILNVTVANPTRPGWVRVWPGDQDEPGTSNVNFAARQVQANEVVTRVDSNDVVRLRLSSGSARVIVDVIGAIGPGTGSGSGFITTLNEPDRLVDSRPASNEGTSATRKHAGNPVQVVLPESVVPAGATGVVLNVTALGASTGDSGYLVAHPKGSAQPNTSNVNWRAGSIQANEVVVRIGEDRTVTITVGGARVGDGVHVIVDVVAFISPTGEPQPSASATSSADPSADPSGDPSATASTDPSASPSSSSCSTIILC